MPSRKQRRRRAKERRHEYEYVYVDDEGNEVEVDPAELERETSARRNGRERGNAASRSAGAGVQPPSLRRVARRGLMIAPLMFLTVHLLGGLPSVAAEVFQTLVLMAFFLPFSYLMDSWMYRRFARRAGQPPASGRR
jgi:hypothetical protein